MLYRLIPGGSGVVFISFICGYAKLVVVLLTIGITIIESADMDVEALKTIPAST